MDRNVQYGKIAVRNNWITSEQFEEALSLHSKLAGHGNSGLKIEQVLLEKGLITDVQHQAVLSVLEQMKGDSAGSQRARKKKTTAAKKRRLVSVCPHCGVENPRGVEECQACQGYIPPTEDDGGVGLLENRTCPSCQRGIQEDALNCDCGAMFCPECRGMRALTDPTCKHCGITFPGMERVARARAAALASGAIKVKEVSGPVATHMPRWVLPLLVVVIGTIFFIAIPKGDPPIDLEAYKDTLAQLEDQKGDAYNAFRKKEWNQAVKLYKKARRTARLLADIAVDDPARSNDAREEIEGIKEQLAKIERLRSQSTTTTGGDGIGGDIGGEIGGDIGGDVGGDVSGDGSGSGSELAAGSGSDSEPKIRKDAVLPENMSEEQRAAALKEMTALKIKLPEPPSIPTDKLILIFHRNGSELFGELLEEDATRYTVKTTAGRRVISTSDVKSKPVRGKTYHRGPKITSLPLKRGYPLKGTPTSFDGGQLMFEGADSAQLVKADDVNPVDYYRAARYAMNASTPEQHMVLARLCLRLGLRDAAKREFYEVARGGREHALLALPYLSPDQFLAWWVKRKSTVAQLRSLARWATESLEHEDRIKVYQRVVQHPELKNDAALQMALVESMMESGKFDDAQSTLEELSKSGNSELRSRAGTALRKLEKERRRLEARLRASKKIRVMPTMVELLDAELAEIATEKQFSDAERKARIDSTFEKLLKQAADKLGLSLDDARDGFRRRRELAPRRPAAKLQYGELTWLVDTPAAMYFGLGTDKVDALKQAHWDTLGQGARLLLLRGMFFESWFKAIPSRHPIAGEKEERDVDDYRGAKLLFEKLPVKARAGYYREIEVR